MYSRGRRVLLEGRHTALLSGRAAHPMSLAARMITLADVKTAKGFVAQLNEMKSREGARRAGSAETARTRDVLHAVVELSYDRFAAAGDVANGVTGSGEGGVS